MNIDYKTYKKNHKYYSNMYFIVHWIVIFGVDRDRLIMIDRLSDHMRIDQLRVRDQSMEDNV